jgi:hypothetical protein
LEVCAEVGSLRRLHVLTSESGLANNFLQRNNIDPTVGLRFRF